MANEARLKLTRAEFNAVHNTPERMLERRSFLLQTATNMTRRLSPGEHEYLAWIVAERKRRVA